MQASLHKSMKTRYSFLSAKESNSNTCSVLLVEFTHPFIANDTAILRKGYFFPLQTVILPEHPTYTENTGGC